MSERKIWICDERSTGINTGSLVPDSYLPLIGDTIVSFEFEGDEGQVMSTIVFDDEGNVRIKRKEFQLATLSCGIRLLWNLPFNAVRVLDFGVQFQNVIHHFVISDDDGRFPNFAENFNKEQMIAFFLNNRVAIETLSIARWRWRGITTGS